MTTLDTVLFIGLTVLSLMCIISNAIWARRIKQLAAASAVHLESAISLKSRELHHAYQQQHAADTTRIRMLAEQLKGFELMKTDTDTIALFLRDRYKEEIQLGYHANRQLGEVVIGYLGKERSFHKATTARTGSGQLGGNNRP